MIQDSEDTISDRAAQTQKRAMKSCSTCHEFKTLAEFDHSRASRDGRHHRCKPCDRERDTQRLLDGSSARSGRRWQAHNPEAVKAHKILQAAVRRGEIERLSCELCGDPKSHGHHPEYSKPLAVTWLCLHCHHEHHRLIRLNGVGQFTFDFWKEATL